MESNITITEEHSNKSNWLKIFIPKKVATTALAIIKKTDGDILRKITLDEGNNSIDITNINETTISVKVETPYETILKHLIINKQ